MSENRQVYFAEKWYKKRLASLFLLLANRLDSSFLYLKIDLILYQYSSSLKNELIANYKVVT